MHSLQLKRFSQCKAVRHLSSGLRLLSFKQLQRFSGETKTASGEVKSFYRRKLPTPPCTAFSSAEGKVIFREAWDQGYMESYFPLIEQFQTQEAPTFCGLSTVTMVLNTLNIDPGRTWQMPWRWYHETMLECCEPDQIIRQQGTTFSQIACLARCNGAFAETKYASKSTVAEFREQVKKICSNSGSERQYLVVSYDRSVLSQTGCGHFSPIGGYHPDKDLVLILDVARFKYPPHWVSLPLLFEAMMKEDSRTHASRGYIILQKDWVQGRFFTISNTAQHRWCEIGSWFQQALASMHGHKVKSHPIGHHSHTHRHRRHLRPPPALSAEPAHNADPILTLALAAPPPRNPSPSRCQIAGPRYFVKKLILEMPNAVEEMISTHSCTFNDQWSLSESKQTIEMLINSVEETSMFKTISNEINKQETNKLNREGNELTGYNSELDSSLSFNEGNAMQLARKEHFLTVWTLACGMALIKRLPPDFDLCQLSEDFDLTGLPSFLRNEVAHVSRQIDALLEENLCQHCPETILYDNSK